MLKMSFYNGTLDKAVAREVITNTDKELKYTYGLSFRRPSTHKKPISKEEALRIIDTQGMLDIDEYEDWIHLNAFSDNDMW
jgi:hypothetical protein